MFACPLTIGSLRGVPLLPPTTGQTTTLEKVPVCVLISKFKSLLILAFLSRCCCPLSQSNSVVSRNKSICLPATSHLVKVVFETFEKWICVEWNRCAIFYLSVTKLVQLLSQWRQNTLAWCGAEPWRLTWGCGMPWPPVYIIHLRPLHSYHEFSAERPGVMVMNMIWHMTQLVCVLYFKLCQG